MYLACNFASILYLVGDRALRIAIRRGSSRYRWKMVDGVGGRGKIYLIDVTNEQIEAAIAAAEAGRISREELRAALLAAAARLEAEGYGREAAENREAAERISGENQDRGFNGGVSDAQNADRSETTLLSGEYEGKTSPYGFTDAKNSRTPRLVAIEANTRPSGEDERGQGEDERGQGEDNKGSAKDRQKIIK